VGVELLRIASSPACQAASSPGSSLVQSMQLSAPQLVEVAQRMATSDVVPAH